MTTSSDSISSISPAPVEALPNTVSVEDAKRAEPIVRAPDELSLIEAKNAHEQNTLRQEQGKVGHFLGSHQDKAGNISFIVILICFGLICVAFFKMDLTKDFDSFMKFNAALFAIITGALGYLFGSGSSGDK